LTSIAAASTLQEPSHLFGHRRKDLARRWLSRDERCHPPERRLLLGNHVACFLRRGRAPVETPRDHAHQDRRREEDAEHDLNLEASAMSTPQ
jgi:hypothetical protein